MKIPQNKTDPDWLYFIHRIKTLYHRADAKVISGYPKRVRARTQVTLIDSKATAEMPDPPRSQFLDLMERFPNNVLLIYKDDIILYPKDRILITQEQEGLFNYGN